MMSVDSYLEHFTSEEEEDDENYLLISIKFLIKNQCWERFKQSVCFFV